MFLSVHKETFRQSNDMIWLWQDYCRCWVGKSCQEAKAKVGRPVKRLLNNPGKAWCGLDFGGPNEDCEKWPDSGHILKIKPTRCEDTVSDLRESGKAWTTGRRRLLFKDRGRISEELVWENKSLFWGRINWIPIRHPRGDFKDFIFFLFLPKAPQYTVVYSLLWVLPVVACVMPPQHGLTSGTLFTPRTWTCETLGCPSRACELNHSATGPAPLVIYFNSTYFINPTIHYYCFCLKQSIVF